VFDVARPTAESEENARLPELHANAKLARDAERTAQDTAAIQALGREASAFTKRLLPEGTTVEVEGDKQERDRHGRLLSYIWHGSEFVNLVVVREGYGQLLTIPPNVRYEAALRACQREAREQRRGLWR
jgi:micrococcal nuclease